VVSTADVVAVDLFAGWGGFTLGATRAGARVVWAANHWRMAVDAHARNHPETQHVCQDLRQADWSALPLFGLLLASPACQPHSTASQPKRRRYHDAMRATAWAVVDCVEVTRPAALVVENVPSFSRWQLYSVWLEALERLGYTLDAQVVRASHHGVPQRRDRLFVTGMQNGARPLANLARGEEPAFRTCIEAAPHDPRWRPLRSASPGVQSRVAKGRKNHGARFLTQHVTGHPGVSLDEPIRTVTTKDQWALVDEDRYRPLTVRETARAMGFPDDYRWPEGVSRRDCITGLGNAVPPPVAADVVRSVIGAL
jgi:DNA (cytosine-5)-methyltransferase 1